MFAIYNSALGLYIAEYGYQYTYTSDSRYAAVYTTETEACKHVFGGSWDVVPATWLNVG